MLSLHLDKYGVILSNYLPLIMDIRNNMMKIKNKTFAILAAPAATPPNPKIPAMIAKTINITVQRNIISIF